MNTPFRTYSDENLFAEVQVNSRPKKVRAKAVCICQNYILVVLGVILSSSVIADVYHNPARQAQQDKIIGYAPYAAIALISRNCPVCLIPNGEAQKR